MSAGRTATDESSRKGPAGDVTQGKEASDYASGGSDRTGRQRAPCEAIIEGVEETGRPGRSTWLARAAVAAQAAGSNEAGSDSDLSRACVCRVWADLGS